MRRPWKYSACGGKQQVLVRVLHIVANVSAVDTARAEEFYGNILGLELLRNIHRATGGECRARSSPRDSASFLDAAAA